MVPTRRDAPFREAMRSLLVFDGAMGSLLYERGVFVTQNFEQLNVTRADVVRKIHEDYVEAGAQIIETNSFGANCFRLDRHGLGAPVVTPGRNPDEIIVTRDNGMRYRVRRKVRAQVLTRPGRLNVGFCSDDERVFGRMSWCEGTQGTIDVGANVPRALKDLLNTVAGQISQRASLDQIKQTIENAEVQTFVELALLKDKDWAFTGDFKLRLRPSGILSKSATVSFDKGWVKVGAEYQDDGTGKQVRVTLDVPLGKRTVRGKKCPEREFAIWWDAECLREISTKNTLPVPGFIEERETLYLYFEYARDILRRDPKAIAESANVVNEILRSDPKLGTALLNKRTLQRLDYLVGQGYWLDSVNGYTSPEGLRRPLGPSDRGPASGWKGNTWLSEKRANKVLKLIKARYGDLPTSLRMRDLPRRMRFPAGKHMPSGVGLSEFPKLDVRPGVELEGAMLDRVMIHGGVKFECNKEAEDKNKAPDKGPFVSQCPEELARMTEGDRMYVTDQRLSDRKRAERLFQNLRRVEIRLSHYRKLSPVDIPDIALVHEHDCPADVIEEAERKWGSRIPFTKPDPPLCG